MRVRVSRSAAPILFALCACAEPPAPSGAGAVPSVPRDRCAVAAAEPAADPRLDSLGALLPARPPGFCLDPHGRAHQYGPTAELPLARACAEVLGPGCDTISGLRSVLAARYLPDGASTSSVDVVLAELDTSLTAAAYLGELTLGDADPAELALVPLGAPPSLVLDGSRLLARRGRHVAWLSHSHPDLAEREGSAEARRDLEALARGLVAALPAADAELPVLAALPSADRLPGGERVLLGEALDLPGFAPSARGHYRSGNKRWRVVTVVRPDPEAAADVFDTLRRQPTARAIRNAALEVVEYTERGAPSEPPLTWVFARAGAVIYGVGDEPFARGEQRSAREQAEVELSLQEKLLELTGLIAS